MKLNKNQQAFIALVEAGLWEKESQLHTCGDVDFQEVYLLAQEQAVVGLVAAGMEYVTDVKVPKEVVLSFVGEALQLEQQNTAMNHFISVLVEKMRNVDIYTLLVKGQGIAQCYERPLWRSCGDIDLLLDANNYTKASDFLPKIASQVGENRLYNKHFAMTISGWEVELHGSLKCGLSHQMDRLIDDVQNDVFSQSHVRCWRNGDTDVFLPSVDNDLIFVFTHFLKHFYKGGLGLRQICDWCRLLWMYRNEIDKLILLKRLKAMRLMSEWKAFAAFAVNYLGMPIEAIPFYESSKKWNHKAEQICGFVLKVGNMGHNRDSLFITTKSYWIRKIVSFYIRVCDVISHIKIFPLDSIRFFFNITFNGVYLAARGTGS